MSKSLDQQKECLQRLGVVHDQTLNVGGIAESILQRVIPGGGRHESKEEIAMIQDRLAQNLYLKNPQHNLNPIQLSQSGRKRAQSLFNTSLKYDDMIDRERRIAIAHENTFQWVFPCTDSQRPLTRTVKWSDLQEWLESDHQLYWITGKPGSGKSTLMKFLCSPANDMSSASYFEEEEGCETPMETYRCHPYLKKWANPSPLVVASFYFWNSGKEMQMTQAGLLRTLLYQITSQCPDIIEKIAPGDWESFCIFGHQSGRFGLQAVHWDTQALQNMIFRAVEALRLTSKICLFIDGLDEFASSHDDLISLVKNLIQRSRQMKICVASRPWNIFQDTLGQMPSLRLEDLTFNDIKVFVESKFYADLEFQKLRWRYPSFTDQLIENIVLKASGVFLWIDVVVTSLLAGMSRGDRIQDFQRRLDELPPDLEKLYEKILYSLDQRDLEHAAQYFNLVERAGIPLTILQFAFADEESPNSALKLAFGPLDKQVVGLRIEAMSRRLNSRCKGFLEINRSQESTQGNNASLSPHTKVQYLHRTLRDFIKSPTIQEYLRSSVDLRFDPSIQLCVAYLMNLKTLVAGYGHLYDSDRKRKVYRITNLMNYCLKAAAGANVKNERDMIVLLDELQYAAWHRGYFEKIIFSEDILESFADDSNWLQINWITRRCSLIPEVMSDSDSEKLFLYLAIRQGAVSYVRTSAVKAGIIMKSVPETLGIFISPLLVALNCKVPNPAMIECLLDLGTDPTLKLSKHESQTPWSVAVTRVSILHTIQTECSEYEEYLTAENNWKESLKLMFLKGGHKAKIPDPLLTPISRRLLKEISDEVRLGGKLAIGVKSWFRPLTTG